jgi:hypothetical protein
MHYFLRVCLLCRLQSADKKAKKRYALEIELKMESFVLVAQTDVEKDTWISKISQAIVELTSVSCFVPTSIVSSKNRSTSSNPGSRSSSSSNLNLSMSEYGTVDGVSVSGSSQQHHGNDKVPEEDEGEEGLLTFDDNLQ